MKQRGGGEEEEVLKVEDVVVRSHAHDSKAAFTCNRLSASASIIPGFRPGTLMFPTCKVSCASASLVFGEF